MPPGPGPRAPTASRWRGRWPSVDSCGGLLELRGLEGGAVRRGGALLGGWGGFAARTQRPPEPRESAGRVDEDEDDRQAIEQARGLRGLQPAAAGFGHERERVRVVVED